MNCVSVLILTLNEEANIGECIDSCAWTDDIVVLDSLSQDRTREIALARGARVVERAFDNYAAQRNAALGIPYKHSWVLMVDADERVPQDLATEIAARVAGADPETVQFRMRRKDFFMGRWLRRSSGYPTWFGRLMRIGRVRVEREVNEEYVGDGTALHLDAHLHHYPFNRGIAYWIERHNRYSSLEAIAKASLLIEPVALGNPFTTDPVERRRVLKQLLYRLPLRPLLVFVYLYIIRLGVLDGRAGYYFSRMRAIYEFLIDLKAIELRRQRRGQAV
ncbi:MAG TPA: glycosyltransferase family 2 protein [Steroidobacteraceae bacterium]|jgi:glycosyltransferase involved in cell wall biosynthesis